MTIAKYSFKVLLFSFLFQPITTFVKDFFISAHSNHLHGLGIGVVHGLGEVLMDFKFITRDPSSYIGFSYFLGWIGLG